MNNVFFFWLIAALCFLMFEMGSPGLFFFISFALGAVVAAVTALFDWSLEIQGAVFVGGSFLIFLMLKWWVQRSWLLGKRNHYQSNVYALRGKHGVVTSVISPVAAGQVKLGGQIWAASSINERALSIGTRVKVINISGNRLVVQALTVTTLAERVDQ